jgi:hypothetical protein
MNPVQLTNVKFSSHQQEHMDKGRPYILPTLTWDLTSTTGNWGQDGNFSYLAPSGKKVL